MTVSKEQTSSGMWRIRVTNAEGRLVTLEQYETEKEAEDCRIQMKALLREKGVPRGAVTVGDWATKWAKDRTKQDQRRIEQHVVADPIGVIALRALTRRHVKQFFRRLEKKYAMVRGPGRQMVESDRPLSAKSQRDIVSLLRQALNEAVEDEKMASNPITEVRLPKPSSRKALSYLYPEEDRRLLTCERVPFAYRFAYGLLAREGLRVSELLRLTWADVDLEHGILTLDQNKTDDPRCWALDEGCIRALSLWRAERNDSGEEDRVIIGAQGLPLNTLRPQRFRDHLRWAGVRRPELFVTTKNRQAIRVHDLRSTFVTLALAKGNTERWVQDRTGHTTNAMLQRYHRMARTAAEVQLGNLLPLDEGLGMVPRQVPRLAKVPPIPPEPPDSRTRKAVRVSYPAPVSSQDDPGFPGIGTFLEVVEPLLRAAKADDAAAVDRLCEQIADGAQAQIQDLLGLIETARGDGPGKVRAACELVRRFAPTARAEAREAESS